MKQEYRIDENSKLKKKEKEMRRRRRRGRKKRSRPSALGEAQSFPPHEHLRCSNNIK